MEEIKYQGKFIKVTEESIEGTVWERVYLNDGVMVYPLTDDHKIYMIKEKRPHEDQSIRFKFVTGLMDPDDQDPLITANREMQEEIGFRAKRLQVLMQRKSSGTINNRFYQIIAQDLVPSKIPNPDGEDSIVSIQAYSIEEILGFLDSGELDWSMGALGVIRIQKMLANGTLS